jgi:hypothetical protein
MNDPAVERSDTMQIGTCRAPFNRRVVWDSSTKPGQHLLSLLNVLGRTQPLEDGQRRCKVLTRRLCRLPRRL